MMVYCFNVIKFTYRTSFFSVFMKQSQVPLYIGDCPATVVIVCKRTYTKKTIYYFYLLK